MKSIARIVLLLSFLLAVLAAFQIPDIKFDHNLERFFPYQDEELSFYRTFKEQFEPDDNFMLVSIVPENNIYDSLFLSKVQSFCDEANTWDQVTQAISITNFKIPFKTDFGLIDIPILRFSNPENYKADSLKLANDPRIVGNFINKNHTAINIILRTSDWLQDEENFYLHDKIIALLSEYEFQEYHIGGRSSTIAIVLRRLQKEVLIYASISTLIVILVVSLIFRRKWGIIISAATVLLGLIYFMGIIAYAGVPLNIMSNLFPTLMLIVGMSDVVHLMSKYIVELQKGLERFEALKITVKQIGITILMTSLTTAIGFASLYTSEIEPLQEFGVFAAVGVLLAYLTVMTFSVACLVFFDAEDLYYKDMKQSLFRSMMHHMHHMVKRIPALISIFLIAIAAISIYGISTINTNSKMLDDIPKNESLRSDFFYFENEFNGVRAYTMAMIAQSDYDVYDSKVVSEMLKLDNYLSELESLKGLSSPISIYKSLHQAYNGNSQDFYKMPTDTRDLRIYTKDIKRFQNLTTGKIYSKDKKMARFGGFIKDFGSDSLKLINDDVKKWISKNIDADIAKVEITGAALMVDKNHSILRKNLFVGLSIALTLVSILMALIFRSWKMVLISLIPNIFPLLVTGAIMGFLGIPLKASTSIIFVLAFGIAVDDTIHFLGKFRLLKSKGLNTEEALYQTLTETGKALAMTTVILLAGFLVLTFSQFTATYYTGLLLCITLFTALLGDLLIIPILIRKFMKDDNSDLSQQLSQ